MGLIFKLLLLSVITEIVLLAGVAPNNSGDLTFNDRRYDLTTAGVGTATETVRITMADDTNITHVYIKGTNPNDFSISNNGCSANPYINGATCDIEITFNPTIDQDNLNAILYVDYSKNSDTTPEGNSTINLSGNGKGKPTPTLSTTSLFLNSDGVTTLEAGAVSQEYTITVTNDNEFNLTDAANDINVTLLNGGTPASTEGSFAITTNSCEGAGVEIEPGDSCTVGITYTSANPGIGDHTETLNISTPTNHDANPRVVTLRARVYNKVALNGSSILNTSTSYIEGDVNIRASATIGSPKLVRTQDWENRGASCTSFTFTNNSSVATGVVTVNLTNNAGGIFTYEPPTSPTNVPNSNLEDGLLANESQSQTICFNPPATASIGDTYYGELTVSYNPTIIISFSGVVVAPVPLSNWSKFILIVGFISLAMLYIRRNRVLN